MLYQLKPPEADPVFELAGLFSQETRADKVDLGVGVYKNPKGQTPVMEAVRAAQKSSIAEEQTKAYVGLSGFPAFNQAISRLVLGEQSKSDRFAALQTPGGAGAVRLLCELSKIGSPSATVWISEHTWAPHHTIVDLVGLRRHSYRFYDAATGKADLERMLDDLSSARPGDIVLLHGCCQNPTGADFDDSEWKEIAEFLSANGLVPLVDIAYQGFGAGIEEDCIGVRTLAQSVPVMLVATSCSKNFGVYRDRVGCAIVMGKNASGAALLRDNLIYLARGNYSMPPHHGALIVSKVLEDRDLKTQWVAELANMRSQISQSRRQFAEVLISQTNNDQFKYIAEQRGMFSLLPISASGIDHLRTNEAIYLPPNGRMNFAGINAEQTARVGRATAEAMRHYGA